MPSSSSGGSGRPWAAQPLANGVHTSVKRLSDPTHGMSAHASEAASMTAVDRSSAPGHALEAPAVMTHASLKSASAYSVPPMPASPCCDSPDQVYSYCNRIQCYSARCS